jgi:hypothetical protein
MTKKILIYRVIIGVSMGYALRWAYDPLSISWYGWLVLIAAILTLCEFLEKHFWHKR